MSSTTSVGPSWIVTIGGSGKSPAYSQTTFIFQSVSRNSPFTFGFSARQVSVLPSSSVVGAKLRVDVVVLWSTVSSRVRRICRLPLYQVMMAFGREPVLWQTISYRLSATSVAGGLITFIVRGFTDEPLVSFGSTSFVFIVWQVKMAFRSLRCIVGQSSRFSMTSPEFCSYWSSTITPLISHRTSGCGRPKKVKNTP
uniref:Uncharacterized protein n=1 Tax=Anopheles melas TaxID=34690 RepID=A0A182TYV2_9DIPT